MFRRPGRGFYPRDVLRWHPLTPDRARRSDRLVKFARRAARQSALSRSFFRQPAARIIRYRRTTRRHGLRRW